MRLEYATHLSDIKSRKEIARDLVANQLAFNFPHALSEINASGTITYAIDGRSFTSAASATATTQYEYSLNCASLSPYVRVVQAPSPFFPSLEPIELVAGDFQFYHYPATPWRAQSDRVVNDPVTIGTVTLKAYSRPSTSFPWSLDSTTVTDIDAYLLMTIQQSGGDANSGGRDAEDDTEKIIIQANLVDDDPYGKLPSFAGNILRFPWDATWTSETTIYADILTAAISAGNTADGGGHSGSCSMSVNFDA